MKKKIWVEWIGLWGSGKSTCITNYTDSLETNDSKYSFTKDFLAKGRLKKFYNIFSSLDVLLTSLKLFCILCPHLLRSHITREKIIADELRSFIACYSARINSLKSSRDNDVLWEGEMHLLPILNLSYKEMDKIIGLLLDINKEKKHAVVVMKIDEKTAFNRILSDIEKNKNIRFKEEHKFDFERLQRFHSNQNKLIDILRSYSVDIFESDGCINNLKKFIQSI